MPALTMQEFSNHVFQENVDVTEGRLLFEEQLVITYGISIEGQPPLKPVGLVIIQHACDFRSLSGPSEKKRIRIKSADVAALSLYDAQEFFLTHYTGQKKKQEKIAIIAQRPFDLPILYLPFHVSLVRFPRGFIVGCVRASHIPSNLVIDLSPGMGLHEIYREKLSKMHAKYHLRVPTADVSDKDIESWLAD